MRKYGCVALVIIIIFVVGFGFFISNKYNNAISKRSSDSTEKVSIIVPQGATLEDIRKKLVDTGIIKDEEILFGYTAFKAYTFFNKSKVDTSKIQAGTFLFQKGSSIEEVFTNLQTAEKEDIKVTIKEGLRIEEIAEQLNFSINNSTNRRAKFNKNDFISLAKNYTDSRESLSTRPVNYKSLEGYLFPDTYFVANDATAEDMIKLMLDTFDEKVYKPNLELIKKSPYKFHQLITLASLIQREVQTPQDMAEVAGILFRRTGDNFPLGIDATVQYALGYSQSEGVWWRKNITAQDLELDSPYNTRKFAGFPPGPIAGFGVTAFNAVLKPTKTIYYYYISDRDCNTRYAKNIAEHEENIRKYGLCG
jgi:UPF0755 protein